MTDPSDLAFEDSILIAVEPDVLYDLVSDVTRTGEWSPVCRECWWDDEAEAGRVGALFHGRNQTSERTWETQSQVVTAEPGREFSWHVNGGWVRWGYTLAPSETGTLLTETWHFTPAGIAGFEEKYVDAADVQIRERSAAAHSGIPKTLAAIKRIAESTNGAHP